MEGDLEAKPRLDIRAIPHHLPPACQGHLSNVRAAAHPSCSRPGMITCLKAPGPCVTPGRFQPACPQPLPLLAPTSHQPTPSSRPPPQTTLASWKTPRKPRRASLSTRVVGQALGALRLLLSGVLLCWAPSLPQQAAGPERRGEASRGTEPVGPGWCVHPWAPAAREALRAAPSPRCDSVRGSQGRGEV